MLYNAKNRSVDINGVSMSYVEFGYGNKPFVLLPGLSDGLKTVKGQAVNLAYFYRMFAKDFKVYVFSRKDILDEGYNTKDMAKELKTAFDCLGIERAYLMGVSQGGMIAQRFVIDNPGTVEKLVIAVSASRPSEVMRNVLNGWIESAKNNDYKSLIIDTFEKMYSPQKLRIYRFAYPLLAGMRKPKDFSRFLIQAGACLTHNTYDELERISCPTLIIGGDCDKIAGADASPEMALKIKGSELYIYTGLGHGAYGESKDFNGRVMRFLQGSSRSERR